MSQISSSFILTVCMWPESSHWLRRYRVVPASIMFNDPVSLWRAPGVRSVLIDRRHLAQDWVYDFPGSLDRVLAYEERGITSRSIAKESLIRRHVISLVAVHDEFHSFSPHSLSWDLDPCSKRD